MLCLALGLILLFGLGGCSLFLAKHVPRPLYVLNTRSHRVDLLRELGPPRGSTVFSPPVEAPYIHFPPEGKAVRRDEYRVNGLRLPDRVGRDEQWDWYPLELVTSAGTKELTTLPATVGELGRRAREHHRLRVWYDRSERIITWEFAPLAEAGGG